MAIKVKILDGAPEEESEDSMILKVSVDDKEIKKISLKARKSIDGNIIIYGHPEMNIFIMSKTSKIVALPKEDLDDELHSGQERLFKFLVEDGIVVHDSVQSGNIFMSMEAQIPEVVGDGDKFEYALYSISKFIDKEMPFYKDQKEFEKEMEDRLLEPEPDEYTEFDPKRHDDNKGSLPPNMISYGINTIYRL
tara:strand:+ start:929 stop:1507 length:579 start_codon:yes stop_codon:yes gene_type:complete